MFAPSQVTLHSVFSFCNAFWGGDALILKLGISQCAPYALDSPSGGKVRPGRQDRLEVFLVSSFSIGFQLFFPRVLPIVLLSSDLDVVAWRSSACCGTSLSLLSPYFSEQGRHHKRSHVHFPSGLSLAPFLSLLLRRYAHHGTCEALFRSLAVSRILGQSCVQCWR